MDFTKISTPELAIYSNKLLTYITDVDKAAMKLQRLMSMPTQQNQGNVDLMEKFKTKTKGAEKIYNKIQYELESRIKKKTGFFMDYNEMTKSLIKIDEDFKEAFENLKKV